MERCPFKNLLPQTPPVSFLTSRHVAYSVVLLKDALNIFLLLW